jgi:hypothetical protein
MRKRHFFPIVAAPGLSGARKKKDNETAMSSAPPTIVPSSVSDAMSAALTAASDTHSATAPNRGLDGITDMWNIQSSAPVVHDLDSGPGTDYRVEYSYSSLDSSAISSMIAGNDVVTRTGVKVTPGRKSPLADGGDYRVESLTVKTSESVAFSGMDPVFAFDSKWDETKRSSVAISIHINMSDSAAVWDSSRYLVVMIDRGSGEDAYASVTNTHLDWRTYTVHRPDGSTTNASSSYSLVQDILGAEWGTQHLSRKVTVNDRNAGGVFIAESVVRTVGVFSPYNIRNARGESDDDDIGITLTELHPTSLSVETGSIESAMREGWVRVRGFIFCGSTSLTIPSADVPICKILGLSPPNFAFVSAKTAAERTSSSREITSLGETFGAVLAKKTASTMIIPDSSVVLFEESASQLFTLPFSYGNLSASDRGCYVSCNSYEHRISTSVFAWLDTPASRAIGTEDAFDPIDTARIGATAVHSSGDTTELSAKFRSFDWSHQPYYTLAMREDDAIFIQNTCGFETENGTRAVCLLVLTQFGSESGVPAALSTDIPLPRMNASMTWANVTDSVLSDEKESEEDDDHLSVFAIPRPKVASSWSVYVNSAVSGLTVGLPVEALGLTLRCPGAIPDVGRRDIPLLRLVSRWDPDVVACPSMCVTSRRNEDDVSEVSRRFLLNQEEQTDAFDVSSAVPVYVSMTVVSPPMGDVGSIDVNTRLFVGRMADALRCAATFSMDGPIRRGNHGQWFFEIGLMGSPFMSAGVLPASLPPHNLSAIGAQTGDYSDSILHVLGISPPFVAAVSTADRDQQHKTLSALPKGQASDKNIVVELPFERLFIQMRTRHITIDPTAHAFFFGAFEERDVPRGEGLLTSHAGVQFAAPATSVLRSVETETSVDGRVFRVHIARDISYGSASFVPSYVMIEFYRDTPSTFLVRCGRNTPAELGAVVPDHYTGGIMYNTDDTSIAPELVGGRILFSNGYCYLFSLPDMITSIRIRSAPDPIVAAAQRGWFLTELEGRLATSYTISGTKEIIVGSDASYLLPPLHTPASVVTFNRAMLLLGQITSAPIRLLSYSMLPKYEGAMFVSIGVSPTPGATLTSLNSIVARTFVCINNPYGDTELSVWMRVRVPRRGKPALSNTWSSVYVVQDRDNWRTSKRKSIPSVPAIP